MITQASWRKTGFLCMVACGVMGMIGVRWQVLRASPILFCVYWGLFVLLALVAVYTAILDLRYIRLRYLIERRELFRETLGNPAFRQALLKGQLKQAKQENGGKTPKSLTSDDSPSENE